MKIVLIGSTQYTEKFAECKARLEAKGHSVAMPAFDDWLDLDSLGICLHNRQYIELADEVHLIWDGRSTGTIFDLGMCVMARKKLVVEYLEPKTFQGMVLQYASL